MGQLETTRASKIVSVDAVAAALLRRPERVLLNKPLAVLIDVADRADFRSRLALVPPGSVLRDWPLRFLGPDERPIDCLASVVAELDETAPLHWTLASGPKRSPHAPPVEADPAMDLDQFLSELAHEINQPLATIVSYASGGVLRSRAGELTKADLEQLLERISAEAHRAGSLLRTIVRRMKVGE